MRSKYWYTRPLAIDLKLFDRIWALQVGGDQHGSVAFLLQVLGKLPSQGRFTGTLETNQHDNCRRIFRKIDLASFATKDLFELALTTLDYLLPRVQCF